MKKNLSILCVIFVFAILIYACKKDSSKIITQTPSQPVTDSISVKDNRLIFSNVSVYENYLSNSSLIENSTSRISQLE